MNADRAYRPGGTRPNLPTLVAVQGWFGANPPGWLRNRWQAKKLRFCGFGYENYACLQRQFEHFQFDSLEKSGQVFCPCLAQIRRVLVGDGVGFG